MCLARVAGRVQLPALYENTRLQITRLRRQLRILLYQVLREDIGIRVENATTSGASPFLHVRALLNVTRNKPHLVEPVDNFSSGIGDAPALLYFKAVGIASNRLVSLLCF